MTTENAAADDAMDKSKIEHLNPQEYTHLPHAEQHFEDHEQTDVAIRPLVWTLFSIAAIIIVSGVGMWGLFELFRVQSQDARDNQQLSAVKPATRQGPEGYPELQGVPAAGANPRTPAQDMDVMRRHNQEILAGARPMRAGVPNGIPIEQAMAEALDKKFFKTAGGSGGATQPATTQQSAQAR